MSERKYVKVRAEFDIEGNMRPTGIVWEDGRLYRVEKVYEVLRRPSLKAGGSGIRYTVGILGQVRYMFYEPSPSVGDKRPGKWFIASG